MLPLGTKEHPLRCSRLHLIVKCSMQTFLAVDEEDEAGPSAHTGSVVHAGCAEFHRSKDEKLEIREKKGWDAIAKAMAQFPRAEESEVKIFYREYIRDPRNINIDIPLWYDGTYAVEKQIDFTLPPHELDPTGSAIHIQGTYDYLRMENGVPVVDDIKTGKKTLWEMIHDHAFQVCAYTYGIKQIINNLDFDNKIGDKALIFDRIKPGKIIRAYGYRARARNAFDLSPDGVFISLPYRTMQHCEWLLETVRLHVALYRMGYVNFGPGYWCTFCPQQGLPGCIDAYEQLTLRESAST